MTVVFDILSIMASGYVICTMSVCKFDKSSKFNIFVTHNVWIGGTTSYVFSDEVISHAIFVALMVVIVGVMYLTQITKTTQFGYQVDELKNQRAALIEENEELEQEAARLQSLERISQSGVAKALEDAGQVEFVR